MIANEPEQHVCGGIEIDRPLPLSLRPEVGGTFGVYIQPEKAMLGMSAALTQSTIMRAFARLESITKAKFPRVDSKGKARLKFEFRGKDSVMYAGTNSKGNKTYFLGKAWTSGRIAFNVERPISTEQLISATLHETLHTFNWKHPAGNPATDNRDRIMNAWLTTNEFHPLEISRLQREFGKGTPTDEMAKLIERINANKAKAKSLQREWYAKLDELKDNGNQRTELWAQVQEDTDRWHELNARQKEKV